uniref:Uncharacterized protein n=1 Tax=Helianthus annuus TaxID=4232 RepID=A0A251UE32_HELAN
MSPATGFRHPSRLQHIHCCSLVVCYLVDPGQLEGGQSKSEGQKDTEGTERTTSSSSAIKSTNDSALSSNSTIVVPVGLSLGANCMLISASFLKCFNFGFGGFRCVVAFQWPVSSGTCVIS